MNDEEVRCVGCGVGLGVTYHDGGFIEPACKECGRRYPASLIKAASDPFSYALKLRTGEIAYFEECRIDGDFVHLTLQDPLLTKRGPALAHGWDRGVDVRVDDIVWCVDAPFGS